MSAAAADLLEGFSVGLYSTWVRYRPFRLVFDCGEGLASRLGNGVFAIRTVLLSHGHLDHLSGLPSLVNIRNNAMGDPLAPLTVVYPTGDPFVACLRDYLARSNPTLSYDLTWQAADAGSRLELDAQRSIEAFAVDHAKGQLTLGYRVVEHRRRLRPELAGLAPAAIRELARAGGREAVSAPYEHPLLVYGGDGLPPAREWLAGADLAVLDGTFLDPADRGRPTHATVDEVCAAATEAGVGHLVVMHISGRYRLPEARRALRSAVRRAGYSGVVRLLWRDRFYRVAGESGAAGASA